MESTGRPQMCPCSCNKYGTDCKEFQKILETHDGSLVVYRHVPETNDAPQKRLSETCEAFILRNSKNAIIQEDLTTVFEYHKMTCPRCIQIVKHAASLVTNVQLVDGQDILGVCDHCSMKERLHCKCKEVVKKFRTNANEQREVQRQRNLLKDAQIDDSKLARSELSVGKLFSELNKSEPKYYKEETQAGDRLETSVQLPNTAKTTSYSERLEDAYTDAKEYLKLVIKLDKRRGGTPKPSFINFPEDKETGDIPKPDSLKLSADKEIYGISRPGIFNLPGDREIDNISRPGLSKLPDKKETADISRLDFLKLPEDKQLVVDKFIREIKTEPKKNTSFLKASEEYIELKTKRKKPSILKTREDEQFKKQEVNAMSRKRSLKDNILKAFSEQDISKASKTQDFTSNSKTSLLDVLMHGVEKQKSLSPEMPWLKSSSEQDLSRDFSFLFPKAKIEIIKKKRISSASSAELIKDLQDTLKRKAEKEKRKKEEELTRKLEEKERKKLEKEEKIKMDAERKLLAAKESLAAKEKQQFQEEKGRLTVKTSPEKADKVPTVSPISTEKAEKGAQKSLKDQQSTEQKEFKRGKEAKLQKQKLEGQESSKKDKEEKLKKENYSFKQDKKGEDKGAIQAEKVKIAAQKLAEKEAQKSSKEQQKKEKEKQALREKNEKLQEQEKFKREKAEKSTKDKGDNLQKDNEGADKSAKKDSNRKYDTKDETNKKDKATKKDQVTKKDEITKKDETAKKDELTKKAETTKKEEKNKKDEPTKKEESTKKEETTKETSNDKKGEEDKQTQRAANDELKALLALQEKEKAEREKLRKQHEMDKELAERKAKEAEKLAKEAKSTNKHEKNKEVKEPPEKPGEPPPKKLASSPPPKDLAFKDVKVRHHSPDDLILRLVKLKQTEPHVKRESYRFSKMNLPRIVIQAHGRHKCKDPTCPVCRNSELGLYYDECRITEMDTNKPGEITDIIIGEKIHKNTTPYRKPQDKEKEPTIELIDEIEVKVKKEDTVMQESPKGTVPTKPLRGKNDLVDPEATKGVIRYALSDRTFIDKGWTMLPTEKVVRKMNVYRMRPAHPEFDWFEHNKYKRLMHYDTGEKLAEFDDNGRGRWFYRSGKLALDYYDAEEINAQQRFVVYSSGEPDERRRTRPRTILATFDYLGNGIVFDHTGKIRLKYNQTEGVVLDRSIGPVSQWKWHTLNDPPVLQQVMIDTQMPYKDPNIMKLGGPGSAKKRVDNEEMLAIEFDNFIKEKSKKLTQKFKPFQIRMKALKINEYFSLRVLDQASVYLLYRDGTTNLKINMGMILDHKEIVDTDTADVGDVSNSMERLPARTDSLAVLQQAVAQAQREERTRVRHERRLHKPADPCASADHLTAAASRPLRPPLVAASSATTVDSKCPCKLRKPPSNLYYDTRL